MLKELSPGTTIVSLDDYYLSEEQQIVNNGFCNFDHPDSCDYQLLIDNINELKRYEKTHMPKYCFKSKSRVGYEEISASGILIVEGLYASKLLKNISDFNIFVDVDLDLGLIRRIKRDIYSRGRELDEILEQYMRFVRPAYFKYVQNMKLDSDKIVCNNGLHNEFKSIALELDKQLNN
jgi:uridine kinase